MHQAEPTLTETWNPRFEGGEANDRVVLLSHPSYRFSVDLIAGPRGEEAGSE